MTDTASAETEQPKLTSASDKTNIETPAIQGRLVSQIRDHLNNARSLASQGSDFMMPLGIISIIAVLIMPMPPWLLDIGLGFSLLLSVMILMVVLFIQHPLEFNAFPTVLLIATLVRLGLNLASTRLILAGGHTGTDAAGHVIQAFGGFVMQNNYVIGIIVFAILVIVNFVVITKGAGRIAEVAARFTLDAMPGKQMAIDADLSAGMIDETEARNRRKKLEDESTFFGSMDGAAKFVRGDAIAGLLITLINIIGGLIIGTAQYDLSLSEAAANYTILTVGDGLITQIPAITVSVAAGLLVSKSGMVGTTEKAVLSQFKAVPEGMALTAMLMGGMSLFPGIPTFTFLGLAALTGIAAFSLRNQRRQTSEQEQSRPGKDPEHPPSEEKSVSESLSMDTIRLELGYGLLSLINNSRGQRLTDQLKALRRQLATEVGFVMPSVRIQDNLQLPANSYVIRIKEIEAGRSELRPESLLIMDPKGHEITLEGEKTQEPTFGLPAMWIEERLREEALFHGYTVVDPPTVITTHLTEIIKENMPELLSFAETQKLLDDLGKEHQKLVSDVIPNQVTVGGLQRVLQNLLAERISIRDLPTVLEGISEAAGYTRNITMMTEHVRARLARQISSQFTAEGNYIPIITLSPAWEQIFQDSLIGEGEERQLSLAPSKLQEFITITRETLDRQAMLGENAVLLSSPPIRPYLRSIIERFRPRTPVISQNEVHPKARIKTLGQI